MSGKTRPSLGRALAWSLLLLPLAACGRGGEPAGRVLVIGIDGASPRVTMPLIAEGRLPHLAGLARQGASGPLLSLEMLLSPVVWTSVATGKRPGKHRILGFRHGDPPRLYLSSDRPVHALWNIASRAGLGVGVVNWWTTYPPEIVDGVMISDHVRPGSLREEQRRRGVEPSEAGATTYPEEWAERSRELAQRDDSLARLARALSRGVGERLAELDVGPEAAIRDGFQRQLLNQAEADAAVARTALEVERSIRPRLLLVLLVGVDRISHMTWAGVEHPTRHPAAAAVIRAYYEYSDALVGRLMQPFGPADLVVVLSDHGFEASGPNRLRGGHSGLAARTGVLFARGPGIAPGATTRGSTVLDVTPTILAWLGLPVGEDMDGRPAAFLENAEPTRVATHDVAPIQRLDAGASGREQEIEEELRALGYLD